MQSIYYGLDGVRLFDQTPASIWTLIEHTVAIARLAEAMDCPVMVFGAPKMRDPGDLPTEIAVERATDILRRLAEIAHDHGTTLCIEPNAQTYGCRFVWTSQQGAEIVRAVDHPGFGLHLDAAAMYLEKEDGPATIRALAPMIRHFHVSEPALAGLVSPQVDHQANLSSLIEAGYTGWVSLESTDEAAFKTSITTLSAWTKQ